MLPFQAYSVGIFPLQKLLVLFLLLALSFAIASVCKMLRPISVITVLSVVATSCYAQTCISIVTETVWATTSTCQCFPSTLATSISTSPIVGGTTTTRSISFAPSIVLTTPSTTFLMPNETPFPIRVFVQDGSLQKRSFYYIAFDPTDLATVTRDSVTAALFRIANDTLQSDGKILGVDTESGFQVLRRYLSAPRISRGWFLDDQRDIQIAGGEFTINGNDTAGFCLYANGTIAMAITDYPQQCIDANLAALPSM